MTLCVLFTVFTKLQFLIRSNNNNRPIEPYEMATIMAEKGLIVYGQKAWNIHGNWLDEKRVQQLRDMIEAKNSESPYLEKSLPDFLDSLGLTKEDADGILPITTILLFVGNEKILR